MTGTRAHFITSPAILLENIQEIINSNKENLLDISVVCKDGSFPWSQFLLAAASDLLARAMQGTEVTNIIFPDYLVEDVRRNLHGLLDPRVSVKTEHGNDIVNQFSLHGSFCEDNYSPVKDSMEVDSLDIDFVKEEIDEIVDDEDLNKWRNPSNPLVRDKDIESDSIMLNKIRKGNSDDALFNFFKSPVNIIKVQNPVNNGEIKPGQSILKGKAEKLTYMDEVKEEDMKKQSFGCYLCGGVFTTRELLKEHKCNRRCNRSAFKKVNQTVFKTEKEVKRNICDLSFESPDQKIQHCILMHKGNVKSVSITQQDSLHNSSEQIYTCNFCEHVCSNVHSLREHKKRRHPGEFLDILEVGEGDLKFRCEFCNACFRTKDNILEHVRIFHKDSLKSWIESVRKKRSSVKSGKSTTKQNSLRIVSSQAPKHIVASYSCNLCEYMCTNVFSLREHRKMCHPGEFLDIPEVGGDDPKFRCEFCYNCFSTKDNILDHVRLNHKENFKSWIETVRQKKNKSINPNKLLRNYYEKDGNSFKCNYCSEIFYALSNFKDHVTTVHKEKYTEEYICDVCGAGFLRKSALNHHSLTHQPAVKCQHCDKLFSTKISLMKHQKLNCIREVVLEFCELCGKGFKTNYYLKVHYNRVHLNLRPFKCTICSNVFKTLTHFQTHCLGKHNIEKEKSGHYLLMVKPEGEQNKN